MIGLYVYILFITGCITLNPHDEDYSVATAEHTPKQLDTIEHCVPYRIYIQKIDMGENINEQLRQAIICPTYVYSIAIRKLPPC